MKTQDIKEYHSIPLITKATLRRLINYIFKTDAEFDAFCMDEFPSIHRNFTGGMNGLQKQNLFLEQIDEDVAIHRFLSSGSLSVQVLDFLSLQRHLDISDNIENPYRGLSAYQFEDRNIFCGRSSLIDKLCTLYVDMATKRHQPRIMSLVGSSGSGKTSVVNAGFVPRIMQGTTQTSIIIQMSPSSAPMEVLASKILQKMFCDKDDNVSLEKIRKTRELSNELSSANANGVYSSLANILRLSQEKTQNSVIIIVDQFEELITQTTETTIRQAFLGNLLNAASAPDLSVVVLIIARIDFLDEFRPFSQFFDALTANTVPVNLMTREELREAISNPAIMAGSPIDVGTIERILDQSVGYIGILPHLQMTLSQIWNCMHKNIAPAAALTNIGGVFGAISSTAERAWNRLDDKQKSIAKRIFTSLVSLGEGVRDTRRKAELSSLIAYSEAPSLIRQVISNFSMPDSRILTITHSDNDQNDYFVELTHEAVIHEWPTLIKWLNTQRDEIRLNRRILDSALRWHTSGMPSGLLWRPPDYELLTSYEQKHGQHFAMVQHRFFIACKEAMSRELFWRLSFIVLVCGSIVLSFIFYGFFYHAKLMSIELERKLLECTQTCGKSETPNKYKE